MGNYSLAWLVLFPLAGALICVGLHRWGRPGADAPLSAWSVAPYVGLTGAALPLFLAVQLVDAMRDAEVPRLLEGGPVWFELGPSVIRLGWSLDPLSSVVLLTTAVLAIAVHAVAATRDVPLAPNAVGLLLALQAGVHALLLTTQVPVVLGAWVLLGVAGLVGAHESGGSRVAWTLEVSSWAAMAVGLGAWVAAAGSPVFDELLAAPAESLRESLLGLPRAELGAAAIGVAVGLRIWGMQRLGAWTEDRGPARVWLQTVAWTLASVALLVRCARPMAFAPWAMAVMAFVAAAVALVAAGRALGARAGGSVLSEAAVWSAGLCLLAVGMGAWSTAVFAALTFACGHTCLGLAFDLGGEDGPLEGTPTWARSWPRRITAVAGAAALVGLMPSAGALALAEVGIRTWVNVSAASMVINVVGAGAVVGTVLLGAAALARLDRLRFARGDDDGADVGALWIVALGTVAMGALSAPSWLPETLSLGEGAWLASELTPLTRFGTELSGELGEFFVGPRADVMRDPAVFPRVEFGMFAAVVVAAILGAIAGRRAPSAAWGPVVRAFETVSGWLSWPLRAMGVLVRGAAELVAVAFDRATVLDGPDLVREHARSLVSGPLRTWMRPWVHLRGWGALAARTAVLWGTALVVGWLFFKPSVASVLPTQPHGFGGLRPRLQKAADPSRAERATLTRQAHARDAAAAEAAEAEAAAKPEAAP